MAKEESLKKNRKRRVNVIEEAQGEPSKIPRLIENEAAKVEFKEASPWKNLQLILSLQDKNKDHPEKVDLAFRYVKSSSNKEMDDLNRCSQVMNTSRTLVFLNNWVQSVLISSEKKMRLEGTKPEFETAESCLDPRCWKILHFCLEESKHLHVSLTCFRDFLRVICCIVLDASSLVNNVSLCCEGTLSAKRVELYDTVLSCSSLVFSFHGGIANENLDLWIVLMDHVLELIVKIYSDQLDSSQVGTFVLQLTYCLVDPFAKFLKIHPTRKNGFRDFIDKLLEPLLNLLHVLHSSSRGSELSKKLSEFVEEVLAQGLFHSTHIDGFLSYKSSSDATLQEGKLVNKSYHRHLFDKVEKIVAEKNKMALAGLGKMFHLFVSCVTKHKGTSVSGGGLRQSVFDYFVQIMEYLLADMNKYFQFNMDKTSILLNASSTLRSISNLLASLINDKVYLRTEDTSEGDSKKFLRSIYDTVMSFSTNITQLHTCFGPDERSLVDSIISLRKELVVIVHHLLDIEYEVVGDDLESLWMMVFSSVACSSSSMDDQPLLTSETVSFGCKLIDLYSELRQVDSAIFALCRAVRNSSSLLVDSESCTPSRSCSSYANSLSKFCCWSEFRFSLGNAIKVIPEGQGAGFVKQLNSDIIESLEWINFSCQMDDAGETTKVNPLTLDFDFQEELLGRVLSEVYTVILDNITASKGNINLFAVSLKNLVEIVHSSFNGRSLNTRIQFQNSSYTRWILVFFFRLLLSCRCLFQDVITLMSSDGSKKMLESIGDMSGCADKAFFPPAPCLSVISSFSDTYIENSVVTCPPLAYFVHAMAIQRLVDLNRLVESSELNLQFDQILGFTKLNDDANISPHNKTTKKQKKRVSEMRKEAAGLIEFILGFLSKMDRNKICQPGFDCGIDDTTIQSLHKYDTPNFPVHFLDENISSLTLWWIICKNVGLWCSYAVKQDLKKFLTLLIRASVSCVYCHFGKFGTCNPDKPASLKKVTAHQIALYFLSNTIACGADHGYMASRFCRIFQKAVISIFPTCEVDLSESPDWVEIMSAFENSSDVASTWTKPNMVPVKSCNKQTNMEFATCKCLLALLMRMPVEHLSSRSSLLYIMCILNFERILIGGILGWYSASVSHAPYEIILLLVSCRRVLNGLTVGFGKTKVDQCQSSLTSRECSFPISWLLKSLSAVIRFQSSLPEDINFEVKGSIFSFMDHTSNVLLTLSRDQFKCAISNVASARKVPRKRKHFDPSGKKLNLSESNPPIISQESSDVWKSVLQLAEALEENIQSSLTSFKDKPLDRKTERIDGFNEMNNLSALIACFKGLLSGLASALGDPNAVNGKKRKKIPIYSADLITGIDPCVTTCINFLTVFLKAYFLQDDSSLNLLVCGSGTLGTNESSTNGFDVTTAASDEGGLRKCDLKRKIHPSNPDLEAFLVNVENVKQCLKKSLLLEVVRGENVEAGFFLQQLFIACSTILRLNLLTDLKSISCDLFPIVVGISEFLLSEFSFNVKMPHLFDFCWLNGIVEFLEALGSYLKKFDPMLSKDFYVKLVDLHIRAIGKCISLQGKEARLASQETGSHAKMLTNQIETRFSVETSRLEGLKARLRMSFRKYVQESSELHLLSAVQAVERALVGVKEGLATKYEIVHGSYGGDVSFVVAAGIDCLDLIIEFVKGHKFLNTVRKHIQSFVSCLFNIVLHLQAPGIFYRYVDSIKDYAGPDPGSVTLMCIETLANISGKSSFFQIDAGHIAQSLRVPGAIFQYFIKLQLFESSVKAATKLSKSVVDRKFSLELYAECCRLLRTTIKNHKSETRNCVALLQESVNVLLNCLEFVNTAQVAGRDISMWEVQEAVTCAMNLRRVYEEVRQEKDMFGNNSFQLLSSYIWVYCGFGPAKCGIIREVDEALRPGIYALIETCSADDLQLLHTVFGEGPCRSSLATLQHDYKLNGKYDGKV